jgi:hypothetical protein
VRLLMPVLLCLTLTPLAALAFGGEDPIAGKPWHHEEISAEAAREAGFAPEAAAQVAWHADYVDSYLYNPLWWAQGGLKRFKVALATAPELTRVHFDDLFTTAQVRDQWDRYTTGTLAGLLWAREQDDPSAARHVLGVSLHAIQDFYSHSNWVDAPDRRNRTWFEVPAAERARMTLYTGAYEHSGEAGHKHHGKFAFACGVLKQPGIDELLSVGCGPYSPLSDSKVCEQWKACRDGASLRPAVLGVTLPKNALLLSPPGIALDNTWLAEVGVKERGLRGVTGKEIFAVARGLAKRTSAQWLRRMEAAMLATGGADFWRQVKSTAEGEAKESNFEDFSRFGHTFVSAGPYPPKSPLPPAETFLRVRLTTGREADAGTNADLVLTAAGKEFLLDYMPRAHPVIAYNDFEPGDDAVYTVGPFAEVPRAIEIENRAADRGEVRRAAGEQLARTLDTLAESARTSLLKLVNGEADFIGTRRHTWSAEQLAAVGAAPEAFSVFVDGRDDGKYRVHGTIRKVADSPAGDEDPWAEFEVALTRLQCVAESKVDLLSRSDEPFLLALLVPLPGEVQRYRTEPFSGVDTGESQRLTHTFEKVRIPRDSGMLSLPLALWESDVEKRQARNQLLTRFAGDVEAATDPLRRDFLDTLGAAVGPDWKLERIQVYAFTKGDVLSVGTVLDEARGMWLKAKQTGHFPLAADRMRAYPLGGAELQTVAALPFRPNGAGERWSAFALVLLLGLAGAWRGARRRPDADQPPPG